MSVSVCPSGLSLELRGLKGKELKLLHDKAAKKTGKTYDNVLSACTVSIVSNGPAYDFEGVSPEWDKVLVGDKFYALLAIRAETFGPAYDFKFQCSACEERIPWTVNLPDGLTVKTLSAEDAAAHRAGAGLKITLPTDGKSATYRLAVGLDERMAAMASRQENEAVLSSLARRIVSIDGVEGGPVGIKKYLDEAGLGDIAQIVKAFETHDCGVETSIEVQCTACSGVQEIRLPLDRNFWMPTT